MTRTPAGISVVSLTVPIVLDASMALKLVTPEPGSDQARTAVLGEELIAPDWMLAEVASGLANEVRYGSIDVERARTSLGAMPRFIAEFFPTRLLLPDALTLSADLSHALYDCVYLVLAIAENGKVITADRKFQQAAAKGGWAAQVELLTWT